jgi:PAS domain S-box-containing protein
MASIHHEFGNPVRGLPSDISASEGIMDSPMTSDGPESIRLLNCKLAELRTLIDTAAEGFCSIDREGVIRLCNASFLHMTGFRRNDEVVGKDFHQSIHHSRADGSPYPRADCPVLRAARTGIHAHVTDEVFYRADGTGFPVEYRARPIIRENQVEGAVCTFVDITGRKQAETRQRLLNRELAHRMKNTLSMAQAIVSQTLRGHDGPEDAVQAINARLFALGHAHELLTHTQWESAPIADVIKGGVAIHGSENWRIRAEGPRMDVGPNTALALTMALHELCTNAVKYGALSNATGTVLLDWALRGNAADARLRLRWKERGGPPVTAPARTGFGSRIISEYCKFELGGEVTLSFSPDGLEWALDAPLISLKN